MLETLHVMAHFKKMRTLVPLCVLAILFSIYQSQGPFWLPVIFGFLSHTVIEYVMHRVAYHKTPSHDQSEFNAQYRSHIGHHEFPQNPEFLTGGGRGGFEIAVGLALSLAYVAILWPIFGFSFAVFTAIKIVFIGNLLGLFFYEYCHTLAHLNVKKGWFGIKVTRDHLVHHFQDHDANFHVSIHAGWLDVLFGTAFDKQKAKARYDRNTILSLGMDPKDVRLILARKSYGLPKDPREKPHAST